MNAAPHPRAGLRLAATALASLALLWWAASAGAAGEFLSDVEDLPLPGTLAEIDGAGIAFDSASGRIVTAYAEGHVSAAKVLQFYAETLPQLGWRRVETGTFEREGERLVLDFLPGGSLLTVQFTLSPR